MFLYYFNPLRLINDTEKRLILILSFASSWTYVRSSGEAWIAGYHESISLILLNSSQSSPSSYRLLSPILISGIQLLTGDSLQRFKWALFAFTGLGLFFSAVMLYVAVKKVTHQHALTHALAFLIIFQVGLIDHYPHPWSIIETGFLLSCLLASLSKRPIAFLMIIVLAVLNRETAIIYSSIYFLMNHNSRKDIYIGASLILMAACTYLIVRFILIGNGPHQVTLGEVFAFNILPNNLGIFGIPALLMVLASASNIVGIDDDGKSINGIDKTVVGMIAVLYAGACIVFGIWKEFRVFLPLYPLLVIIFSPLSNRKT